MKIKAFRASSPYLCLCSVGPVSDKSGEKLVYLEDVPVEWANTRYPETRDDVAWTKSLWISLPQDTGYIVNGHWLSRMIQLPPVASGVEILFRGP